jgi:hypothetical protein
VELASLVLLQTTRLLLPQHPAVAGRRPHADASRHQLCRMHSGNSSMLRGSQMVLLWMASQAGAPCRRTGLSSKCCLPTGSSTHLRLQKRLLPGAPALLQRPQQMLLGSNSMTSFY